MTALEQFLATWKDGNPRLLVHTSGSTGKPKPIWVEKERMEASARMTLRFLGLKPGDTALLCMSLDYIAGMMMVVRAVVGQLHLVDVAPSGHPLTDNALAQGGIDFAAMVPLQVYNSMAVPEELERLRSIRQLIIGGGSVDEAMAARLKDFPYGVWSTYGMTETLSHVAMRRLSGPMASEWYEPLDGVVVAQNGEGCLVVEAPRVCPQVLVTNDIVEMAPDGQRFKVLGRSDNVICSGGVKIQAEEVERRLQPFVAAPFMVAKKKDGKFGEIAVLVVEGEEYKEMEDILAHVLPKYWIPKKTIFVKRLPRTATGKPRRNLDA